MPKTYKYQNLWCPEEETEIWLKKTKYMFGDHLAIEAWCDEGPYTTVTVNLPGMIPDDCAYVDTNNNAGMDRWLEKNGIAEFTGVYGQSGFCTYPLMRFDLSKI